MEYQMKNHVMDKIKIKYGTILNVLKYKHSSPYVWLHGIKFTKKNSERISAGIYKTTVDIETKYDGVLPKGALVVDSSVSESVSPQDYRYEIKVSGGTISGTADEVINELKDIIAVIETYKEME